MTTSQDELQKLLIKKAHEYTPEMDIIDVENIIDSLMPSLVYLLDDIQGLAEEKCECSKQKNKLKCFPCCLKDTLKQWDKNLKEL